MGATRTELFGEHLNELASLTKALGHPARIAILDQLMKNEEHIDSYPATTAQALVKEIGLSQPTISQHLTVLKNQGLIHGSVIGSYIYYTIDPGRWDEMRSKLMDFLHQA